MPPRSSSRGSGRGKSSSGGAGQRRNASTNAHHGGHGHHGGGGGGGGHKSQQMHNHPNIGLGYSHEPTIRHQYNAHSGGGGVGLRHQDHFDNSARFTPAARNAESKRLQQILAKNYHAAHPDDVHAQLEDSLLDAQFKPKNAYKDSGTNYDVDTTWISDVDHVAFEQARRYRPTNPALDEFPKGILETERIIKNAHIPGQERFQAELEFPEYPKHAINLKTDESRFRHTIPPISPNDTDTGFSRFELFEHEQNRQIPIPQKQNIPEGRFGRGKERNLGDEDRADVRHQRKIDEREDRIRQIRDREEHDARGAYRYIDRRIAAQRKELRDQMYQHTHSMPLWWVRLMRRALKNQQVMNPNLYPHNHPEQVNMRRDTTGAHWQHIFSEAHKAAMERQSTQEHLDEKSLDYAASRRHAREERGTLDEKLHYLRHQAHELQQLQHKVQDLRAQHFLDKEKRLEKTRKERQNIAAVRELESKNVEGVTDLTAVNDIINIEQSTLQPIIHTNTASGHHVANTSLTTMMTSSVTPTLTASVTPTLTASVTPPSSSTTTIKTTTKTTTKATRPRITNTSAPRNVKPKLAQHINLQQALAPFDLALNPMNILEMAAPTQLPPSPPQTKAVAAVSGTLHHVLTPSQQQPTVALVPSHQKKRKTAVIYATESLDKLDQQMQKQLNVLQEQILHLESMRGNDVPVMNRQRQRMEQMVADAADVNAQGIPAEAAEEVANEQAHEVENAEHVAIDGEDNAHHQHLGVHHAIDDEGAVVELVVQQHPHVNHDLANQEALEDQIEDMLLIPLDPVFIEQVFHNVNDDQNDTQQTNNNNAQNPVPGPENWIDRPIRRINRNNNNINNNNNNHNNDNPDADVQQHMVNHEAPEVIPAFVQQQQVDPLAMPLHDVTRSDTNFHQNQKLKREMDEAMRLDVLRQSPLVSNSPIQSSPVPSSGSSHIMGYSSQPTHHTPVMGAMLKQFDQGEFHLDECDLAPLVLSQNPILDSTVRPKEMSGLIPTMVKTGLSSLNPGMDITGDLMPKISQTPAKSRNNTHSMMSSAKKSPYLKPTTLSPDMVMELDDFSPLGSSVSPPQKPSIVPNPIEIKTFDIMFDDIDNTTNLDELEKTHQVFDATGYRIPGIDANQIHNIRFTHKSNQVNQLSATNDVIETVRDTML